MGLFVGGFGGFRWWFGMVWKLVGKGTVLGAVFSQLFGGFGVGFGGDFDVVLQYGGLYFDCSPAVTWGARKNGDFQGGSLVLGCRKNR
ncbi:hypothetical protein EJD97_009119 [Solanum chilense]|uniref:Uncharacterized protein n=1 Tax=Solanum chilense TaxID=4083 RepID=A0A6N2AIP4_SOLCI|nr:hypothetical protein EJD97_009119 [Solanum chilense]